MEKTILVLDYDGTLHDSSAVYEPAFRRTMKEISALGWIPEAEYTSEEILYWVGFPVPKCGRASIRSFPPNGSRRPAG